MRVRKKLRRVKRFAYLGLFTGTVVAVRRRWTQRSEGLGPPSTWPDLEPSPEPPVAAVGDLVRAAEVGEAPSGNGDSSEDAAPPDAVDEAASPSPPGPPAGEP